MTCVGKYINAREAVTLRDDWQYIKKNKSFNNVVGVFHVTAFRFYFFHSTFTSNPLENHENVSPIFKDLNWAQVTHWFDSRNDRLKLWIFFCNLQAYSTHHLPDHATINIQISDANDNPPTFSAKYYSFSIKENAGIGAIVGEVKASDVDQVSSSSFVMFCVSEKTSL